MKIYIDSDEAYPVYSYRRDRPYDTYGTEVEVKETTIARWNRINREYEEMQEELAELSGEI